MRLPLLLILSATVFLASCTEGYYPSTTSYNDPDQKTITSSLFQSPDQTISEANIQRLLNGHINLPDSAKVAIYNYGSTSTNKYYNSYWNDEEYLKTQQQFTDTLITSLESSARVKDAFPIPSMMTGSSPTVTQLREMAVRLQADLLFIYSVKSDIYYKYKAFQKNEAKAYATVECLVLDTRTGVIPFSSILTNDLKVAKNDEDWTNSETMKRAENGAISMSLGGAGIQTKTFLSQSSE